MMPSPAAEPVGLCSDPFMARTVQALSRKIWKADLKGRTGFFSEANDSHHLQGTFLL
jgi:hypothetical protein